MTTYNSMKRIRAKRRGRNMLNTHLKHTYTIANDGGGCVVEIQRILFHVCPPIFIPSRLQTQIGTVYSHISSAEEIPNIWRQLVWGIARIIPRLLLQKALILKLVVAASQLDKDHCLPMPIAPGRPWSCSNILRILLKESYVDMTGLWQL